LLPILPTVEGALGSKPDSYFVDKIGQAATNFVIVLSMEIQFNDCAIPLYVQKIPLVSPHWCHMIFLERYRDPVGGTRNH